jgi:hypothetical protein
MLRTYRIETGCGKLTSFGDKLDFLSEVEAKEFDSIGYSSKKLDGTKMDRETYLNSLGKGEFDVTQTKYDKGDFSEAYTIARAILEKEDDNPTVTIEDCKFHMIANLLEALATAKGRLEAYIRVSSNTWGALSTGSDEGDAQTLNGLKGLSDEVKKLALNEEATFNSDEMTIIRDNVYAYIKYKSLN